MPNKTKQFAAYGAASQTTKKTKQVVMLYDGIIKFVKKAKEAIIEDRIEERFNSIQRACNIILGLQSGLDFERGGNVSELLNNFYSSIDTRLLLIHDTNDVKMCDQIIAELKVMRDAWEHVHNTTEENSSKEVVPGAVLEAVTSIAVSA